MWLMRPYPYNNIIITFNIIRISITTSARHNDDKIEFRVLKLLGDTKNILTKKKIKDRDLELKASKINNMSDMKNWQAMWPTAHTFNPSVVPLPVRQGYPNNDGIHPAKFESTELMKIPNFLHLTPPVVKRHCDALKKFCTKWPKELETDEVCEKHFPVQIVTSDYCYSSPSIREPLARIVTANVKLSSLYLNAHAKDKMLRLLGDKYSPKTDVITIIANRCPTRKQNLDYVKYLLTALFHISWVNHSHNVELVRLNQTGHKIQHYNIFQRIEPWEAEKSEADMEHYDWDKSQSKATLISLYNWPNSRIDSNYEDCPHIAVYRTTMTELMNNGEDQLLLNKYKQIVKNVLNLKSSSATV